MVHQYNQRLVLVVHDDPSAECVVDSTMDKRFKVEQYSSADEFLAGHSTSRPACLVGLFEVHSKATDFQWRLRSSRSDLPLVLISHHADAPIVVTAMRNGAFNVLELSGVGTRLENAIEEALDFDTWQCDKIAEQARQNSRLMSLTRSEEQVLHLVLEGKPNKAIASALDVSTRTVEKRRGEIFRKTQTSSVAQLVRFVMTANLQNHHPPWDRWLTRVTS